MPTFEVYVDDDRYEVPSLYLITALNEIKAQAMAQELWQVSEHHRGVELRLEGRRLSGHGSMASPSRTECDCPDEAGS